MPNCRHCFTPLELTFVDLGHQPPSNAYLAVGALEQAEVTYPLKVFVCEACWLVQLPTHVAPEILFSEDYAYFSSVSQGWLRHAEAYVKSMVERFRLGPDSFVVEIASNDGYLLQFAKAAGMKALGVEPTAAAARAARKKGIETQEIFFGRATAAILRDQYGAADLMPANNVLAHVPDINDFVSGFDMLLSETGVATFEFPHLLNLVEGRQFDTIYHEHYSYLSLLTVKRIVEKAGLRVFDVGTLSTHGGSLRVFCCRAGAPHRTCQSVDDMLNRERAYGLHSSAAYAGFQGEAERIKHDLLVFLIDEKRAGRTVAGYGAAAKGNTLLNFAGVRSDLLPFVCDAAPSKQGRFLPGSHIAILSPSALDEARPDTVLILPWNIAEEVRQQLSHLSQTGTRFVTAIPELVVS